MAGLAQVGEVRNVGVPAVLVVVDVVGVAVLGVGGACDAAAVADGQDDPLRVGRAADSAQGELAPVAVEDGGKGSWRRRASSASCFAEMGVPVIEPRVGKLPRDAVVVGGNHQAGAGTLAAQDQIAQSVGVALGEGVLGLSRRAGARHAQPQRAAGSLGGRPGSRGWRSGGHMPSSPSRIEQRRWCRCSASSASAGSTRSSRACCGRLRPQGRRRPAGSRLPGCGGPPHRTDIHGHSPKKSDSLRRWILGVSRAITLA